MQSTVRIIAGGLLALACGWSQEKPILTPKPGPEPRINGPKVYGCRPGKPFLYRIPCTGARPMRFSARGLPSTLKLDPGTGIITGRIPQKAGSYRVTLQAANARGRAERALKLVAGEQLALTPPMGWNDWYTHYRNITAQKVRAAADAMVASGMADFGYQYVSIDDCWMVQPGATDPMIGGPARDQKGRILPNRHFGDMAALVNYIHGKGLKAGIYTSPGRLTCARYEGAYQHEEADARQFAEWGFDLLKYDWCSYRLIAGNTPSLEERQKPYRQMGSILRSLDRDVVFNLCQYGAGDVWKWGGDVGGQSWRTTGDLGLAKDTGLPGFYSIGLRNAALWEYARPGRWNDPDYILIGTYGDARKRKEDRQPTPTSLTADEQYSYMSMWSLMASPLFFSGDMSRLDDFTINVLCNAEVLDVNQDTLGRQAKPVRQTAEELVLAKPLEDKSLAVGLFNLSGSDRAMRVDWKELGLRGRRRVRDLWRQKDLGPATGAFTARVPRHGVAMVRIAR